ncbi:MAG: C45 family peptidase [Bacillota bacterium]|nr:C45 family peptidase [Bacillota bacterium]
MRSEVRHLGTLTYIRAQGSDEDIGYAVGHGAARQIGKAAAMFFRARPALGLRELTLRTRPFADALEEHMARSAAELRGIARGAGVPYLALVAMNSGQEMAAGRVRAAGAGGSGAGSGAGCSCVVIPPAHTHDGHVLLAHNEDSGAGYEDTCYVVHGHPDQGPAYLAFTYAGLLLHQGLNSSGIAQVGNALYFRDIRPRGTPKLPAYREALNATHLEQAIRAATAPHRANGQNHLLADRSGMIVDVEVSATSYALLPGVGRPLVHTNHARDPEMRKLESGDLLNSRLRQARLEELVRAGGREHTAETLLSIMRDHANYPKSVCKHIDPVANPAVRTVASVVIDLTAGRLDVAAGYPCEAKYESFQL